MVRRLALRFIPPDGNEHDFLQLKDFFSEEEFTSCEHWIDGSFDDTGCFSGKLRSLEKLRNIVIYLENVQNVKLEI